MNMIDHSDICFRRLCKNGCKVGSVMYDKLSSHSAPTHPALYFHWATLAGLQRQGEEPHSETPMERGWEPPVLPLTVSLLPTPTHLSKSVQTLQLYNLTQEHWFNLCTPSLIVPEKSNHSLGCRQENFIPDHPNATQTHTYAHTQAQSFSVFERTFTDKRRQLWRTITGFLSHNQHYFSSSLHISIPSPQLCFWLICVNTGFRQILLLLM